MTLRSGQSIPLALGLLALAAMPTVVSAQGNAMNPYGNSGYADYRDFSVPSYSNNPALPGQARLNGEPIVSRPRANSYRDYIEDDQEFDSIKSRTGSSAGVPYNEAYQRLNRKYSRVYKANDSKENDAFLERMKKRDAEFAAALKEKDPIKRAKLLRQLDNQSIPDSAQPKSKSATASRAPDPNKVPKGTATTRAPLPNSGRTSSAPPPVSSVGTTGPITSGTKPAPARGSSAPRTGGSTSRPAPDPSTIGVPAPR